MPVTKQAIKKVRQDKKKAKFNLLKKTAYKKNVANFLKNPTESALKAAFSALDLAAKTNVIHKNKAARLKSRLSKKIAGKKTAQPPKKATPAKTTKKSTKK